MSESLRFFLRFLVAGVLWIFILSIPVGGQPLFFPLRTLIVRNPVVTYLGNEINLALLKVKRSTVEALREAVDAERMEI